MVERSRSLRSSMGSNSMTMSALWLYTVFLFSIVFVFHCLNFYLIYYIVLFNLKMDTFRK